MRSLGPLLGCLRFRPSFPTERAPKVDLLRAAVVSVRRPRSLAGGRVVGGESERLDRHDQREMARTLKISVSSTPKS